MKVNQIETCKKMVSQGLGYAIFPSLTIIEDEDLFKLKLVDLYNEPITRKTAIIYKDKSIHTKPMKVFIEFLILKMEALTF